MRDAALLGAQAALSACRSPFGRRAPAATSAPAPDRVVLVRFGGGVRAGDVFPTGSAPSLAPGLVRRAGRAVLLDPLELPAAGRHDVATRVLLTGREDGDPATLRSRPTLFEAARSALRLGLTDVLAAGVPETSDAAAFGASLAALPIAPEHRPLVSRPISDDPSLGPCAHVAAANLVLAAAAAGIGETQLPHSESARRRFCADAVSAHLPKAVRNSPMGAVAVGGLAERLAQGRPYVRRREADAFLLSLTLEAMRRFRPRLVVIAFSTPDLAHFGAWHDYARAVRGADALVDRLDRFLDEDRFYRGRTVRLLAPDCGRERLRFDAHRAERDEEGVRHGFLLAWGPRTRPVRDRGGAALADVAGTAAALLGFEMPGAGDRVLGGVLSAVGGSSGARGGPG